MARSTSPLRYPGGKTTLYPLVAEIIRVNGYERRPYVEPFAGGGGLALSLLYGGHVSDLYLNDVDKTIWAFWYSVLYRTDELINKIMECEISIDEWQRQRAIHANRTQHDTLDVGFSTFFLNRTNRSGIIEGAGVIGGIKQEGKYKIDCRLNRKELSKKIARIQKYSDRINLFCEDAVHFIPEADKSLGGQGFFCVDPPYFLKGASLYTNFYAPSDHVTLSKVVQELYSPWIVTYDNAKEISNLYSTQMQYTYDIHYSARAKRRSKEMLISPCSTQVPRNLRGRQVTRHSSQIQTP